MTAKGDESNICTPQGLAAKEWKSAKTGETICQLSIISSIAIPSYRIRTCAPCPGLYQGQYIHPDRHAARKSDAKVAIFGQNRGGINRHGAQMGNQPPAQNRHRVQPGIKQAQKRQRHGNRP